VHREKKRVDKQKSKSMPTLGGISVGGKESARQKGGEGYPSPRRRERREGSGGAP